MWIDEVFNEQFHFGSIDVISQLAHISNLANHVSQRLIINLIYSQLSLLIFQIDVALILVNIEIILCDLLESLDGINEVSSMELVLEIPAVGFEFG